MGVDVRTRGRPILPEAKVVTFEPGAADGSIDLSAHNSRGRVLYNERQFDIDIHAKADDISALQRKLSAVAAWLSGDGELMFDDLPGVIWKARRTAMIDYAPERAGKMAVLSVSFFAEPFSYASFTVLDGIKLGTAVPIGAAVPLGLEKTLTFAMSTSGSTMVDNIGTAPTRPVVTIDKPYGSYTVTIGDISITAGGVNATDTGRLVIDCENYTVSRVNALYPSVTVSGTFPELAPGVNTITITGSFSGTKTVTVDYLPRYLYGAAVN